MTNEWTLRLWHRLKDFYGQKWMSLFQGADTIDSWVTTWATLECTAEEIKYALERLPNEFAEWPPTYGQFKALLGSKPKLMLPAPAIKRTQPSAEQAAAIKKIATAATKPRLPWWTPDKVRNQAQVDFIVMQARHFGKDSDAGRFLYDCISAGVITQDLEIA